MPPPRRTNETRRVRDADPRLSRLPTSVAATSDAADDTADRGSRSWLARRGRSSRRSTGTAQSRRRPPPARMIRMNRSVSGDRRVRSPRRANPDAAGADAGAGPPTPRRGRRGRRPGRPWRRSPAPRCRGLPARRGHRQQQRRAQPLGDAHDPRRDEAAFRLQEDRAHTRRGGSCRRSRSPPPPSDMTAATPAIATPAGRIPASRGAARSRRARSRGSRRSRGWASVTPRRLPFRATEE